MNIPNKERWLHTPQMKAKLARADTWMRVNPPRDTDLAEMDRHIERKDKNDSI
ncbi:hypothetical protein ICHIJ1_17920 [Fluviibacter phosphoraccumulans]|uniref:hypothetical protein n=1 Tax=Fluviibacter phosphoraccumulans TaxID=1751046 RepID=UPI0013673049|nr:hypothetical protein [Fluviibacter phosphoraccumulans]BBU71873.1 hypothetical protein ICHIJ1_17920 [Fluviibacter phosphoraccumulans]